MGNYNLSKLTLLMCIDLLLKKLLQAIKKKDK